MNYPEIPHVERYELPDEPSTGDIIKRAAVYLGMFLFSSSIIVGVIWIFATAVVNSIGYPGQ